MIRFFRNIFPRRVAPITVDFLIRAFEQFDNPTYTKYIDQLRDGLLKCTIESHEFPNYVSFSYMPRISGRYEEKRGRFMRIAGIQVRCKGRTETVSIYLTHGLVCGIQFETSLPFKPDLHSIDVSNAKTEYLDFKESVVAKVISDEELALINWSDVYEVELDGIIYYHLADIGDGDFVGIDSKGDRFEIRHDPFEIRQRYESIGELLCQYRDI